MFILVSTTYNARMSKENRLGVHLKFVLPKVYDYFSKLKQHGSAQGVLRRISEATCERTLYCFSVAGNTSCYGITVWEYLSQHSVGSGGNALLVVLTFCHLLQNLKLPKVVDDLNRKAIQRLIHQVYETKEHLALLKLFPPGLSTSHKVC